MSRILLTQTNHCCLDSIVYLMVKIGMATLCLKQGGISPRAGEKDSQAMVKLRCPKFRTVHRLGHGRRKSGPWIDGVHRRFKRLTGQSG